MIGRKKVKLSQGAIGNRGGHSSANHAVSEGNVHGDGDLLGMGEEQR